MSSTSGIILTSEGKYLEARVSRSRSGTSIPRFIRWGARDWVHRAALLHRGVIAGVPAHWQHQAHALVPEGFAQAPDDGTHIVAAQQALVEVHAASLRSNCLGVAPDEACLATLPAAFSPSPPSSYLTVHSTQDHCAIGVTINRRLTAVFHFTPASVEGNVGRVVRYLRLRDPQTDVPRVVFLLGETAEVTIDEFDTRKISIPGTSGSDDLKALGLACIEETGIRVPRFEDAAPEARFRFVRTGLLAGSIAVVVVCLLSCAGVAAASWWYQQRLTRYAADYQRVLTENREVRALLDESRLLAEKMGRMQKLLTRKPAWTQLLDALARDRPAGLYFERIGTSPVRKGGVEVALAGWAEQERSVTDLIGRLQKKSLLSDVSLKFMERDEKRKDLVRFKVQCTLKLSGE